jgi:gas vesicle protein
MSKPVQTAEAVSVISSGATGDTKPPTELAADGIANSIQRLASTSADQIDRLITELTQLRDRLQIEGERVQHEIVRVQNQIAGYMETNDAVMESVNGIGRTLVQFKALQA